MTDKTPPLTKYQKFTYEEIPRVSIEMAHYNPRKISEGNKKRLSKSLTDHGIVETLIWNKRTGRLVSGHQRISDLDSKHHGTNYSIGVAVIDVDEKEEVTLNGLLNNPSTQGVYDNSAIAEISTRYGIPLQDFGYSREDILIDFNVDIASIKIGAPTLPSVSAKPGTESPGILGPEDEDEAPMSPEKALMAAKFASRHEQGYQSSAGGTFMVNEDDCRLQIVYDTPQDLLKDLEILGLDSTSRIIPASTFKDLVAGAITEGRL